MWFVGRRKTIYHINLIYCGGWNPARFICASFFFMSCLYRTGSVSAHSALGILDNIPRSWECLLVAQHDSKIKLCYASSSARVLTVSVPLNSYPRRWDGCWLRAHERSEQVKEVRGISLGDCTQVRWRGGSWQHSARSQAPSVFGNVWTNEFLYSRRISLLFHAVKHSNCIYYQASPDPKQETEFILPVLCSGRSTLS